MEEARMERTVAAPATKLTHADYLLFPDDGKRRELIDGEVYVMTSASLRHQVILRNIFRELDGWARERGVAQVFFAPLDVIFTDHDVVEPDLILVREERREILQDWVRGVPELLVEIVSPSNRRHDEVRKRDLYDRVGVEEYWVVDPEVETVKVYRREGGGYGRARLASLHGGDALTSPLLPGLEIPLSTVFAE
jgi:Uma2 family endonuclease